MIEKKKPKRDKGYRLRMTTAEDDRLKQLSKETGMSRADVMRDALEKYSEVERYRNVYNDDLK